MATPFASAVTVCLVCGEPLKAKGECLACLLRAGLDERVLETESSVSRIFGDFEVEQRADGFYWELGHGAMGVTYLAMDKVLRRRVALKVIDVPDTARGSQAVRERFLREARAAAALRHPNVAAVFQFGASPDATHCYYAMELVEGETLEARVEREGPLKAEPALEISIQITRALMAAAAHNLIHRDLKPGNIMLTSGNAARTELEVKVIDFGLAKAIANAGGEMNLTHEGFIGTPTFASPEQFGTGAVDARSDIYSLGATLWFALTGLAPRSGSTIEEIRNRHTQDDLPVEQLVARRVPQPVIRLLRSMLAVDPGKRPASGRELMEALESCRRKLSHRTGVFYKLSALIVAVAIVAAALFVLRANRQKITSASASSIAPLASVLTPFPEKSIAVLPFENLSADPENAFFADGVQDEILSDLAKIADLKVISRISVMQYKTGVKRNVREIAQQLGVSNVVEGSVQRSGNRVRVNAQLIDTRSDRQLWGQTYDRDLADVFAIQSEIAKAIADELHAKLSQNERSEIERAPTSDIIAFDLYTRAMKLVFTPGLSANASANLVQAIDLLNQAVARDPSFFRAYCQMAYAHDALYFFGHDHTVGRLTMAEAALQAAFRLRPGAGGAHLARAWHLYWAYLDYDGALAELEVARQTLPNDPQVFYLTGLIQRRQGRWEQSTRAFERAAELDPRNFEVLHGIAANYATLARYPEQQLWLGRVLDFEPNNAGTKVVLAEVDFEWRADTRPLHQMTDSVRATHPAAIASIANSWLVCALAERNAIAARDALIAIGEIPINLGNDVFSNRAFVEGVIARMTKDDEKARLAFTAARAEQEKIVQAQPDFGPAWCVLGLIDAALGRKEEAFRAGRRAVELLPVEKDAIRGLAMIKYLAMIAAWTGDKDLACQQLATLARPPSPLSYGQLKLLPFWDPLRGDPRFEKIVASLAPKLVP
jgi:serine/threonine protein kinase/tetratricopeptide (TPR) repeat protein